MKIHRFIILLCLSLLIATNHEITAQSKFNPNLIRRNPDGWFNLLVPKTIGKVGRHADVSGGFYIKNGLTIDYTYWTFDSTPNWLRDVVNNYSKAPQLICSTKNKKTRTLRTRIDGKRAIIQQCSKTDELRGFRYIYYITFPKIKVHLGGSVEYGMFNLTLENKNRRFFPLAKKIVHSINFQQ